MFYSHEILTSPDHGVATIWLVATLGSRSISRRLNRKTILDVDVPKACGVIMDPMAPMALRLQGNLLYGVSRVYSQQCGYTLTDVQAMHDRMRTMLRCVPAGGLDPAAGKARLEQLILPYDPSFLPEYNLPGLGLDLSKLGLPVEEIRSQQSSVLWPQTPVLSQSSLTGASSPQLNLPSDDIVMGGFGEFGSKSDITASAPQHLNIRGLVSSDFNNDVGVLLHPDFEFDEDGNIIELGRSSHNETRTKREHSKRHEMKEEEMDEFFIEDQQMLVDKGINMATPQHQPRPTGHPHTPNPNRSSVFDAQESTSPNKVIMHQIQRAPKVILSDDHTALRNSELADMNNEYVRNMATILKQKRLNKITTQAKKNAAYWVFGLGIGAVGTGVGSSRVVHPLCCFSGNELFDALNPPRQTGSKRPLEGAGCELDCRHVRAKRGSGDHTSQQDHLDEDILHEEDVEIGRHAPSILLDNNFSQMPWNITASVQSSRQELSTTNIFPKLGSLSDFSSHGILESAISVGRDSNAFQFAELQRARTRLTSASPLAGRGFPYDIEIDSLAIPGNENDDINDLDGFGLGQYLETDFVNESKSNVETGANNTLCGYPTNLQSSLSESIMDEESLNFLNFLSTKMKTAPVITDEGLDHADGVASPSTEPTRTGELSFSELLPPQATSRKVATQALMHTLALTTKGLLSVRQTAHEDQSSEEHGIRYKFGEIFLRLSGV